MKRLAVLGPALLLAIAGAAPASAQRPARPPRQMALDTAVADRIIRSRRQSSNEAIARHDTAGIAAIFAPNVVVVSSASDHTLGKRENTERFAEIFKARPDVVYRRVPDTVEVFAPWLMASEKGHWTGSWTGPDGKISIGGSYFAKWRIIGDQWLVESETYVPVSCSGGAYCTTKP